LGEIAARRCADGLGLPALPLSGRPRHSAWRQSAVPTRPGPYLLIWLVSDLLRFGKALEAFASPRPRGWGPSALDPYPWRSERWSAETPRIIPALRPLSTTFCTFLEEERQKTGRVTSEAARVRFALSPRAAGCVEWGVVSVARKEKR